MPTTIPPPTAEHSDADGHWPRAHRWALGRELDALASDVDVVHLPSGARSLPDDEVAALVAGRVRVGVAVYSPAGMMHMHSLGWVPRTDAPALTQRILDHLPGARVEDERPDGAQPQAIMVLWGSRRPGWTPTAVHVQRGIGSDWREREDLLTAPEVAEFVGVTASTWRSYQARRDASVPGSLGTAPVGPHGRALEVWDREHVMSWHASRPGKGGRPPRGDAS